MFNSCRKPTNGLDTRTNGDCVYSELLYQLLELYLITLYKTNRTEAELQDIRNRINAAIQLDVAHQLWPVNKNFLRVYVKDGEDNGFTTFEGDCHSARGKDDQADIEGNGLTAHVQVDKEGNGLTARDEDDQVDKEGDGLTAHVQVDKEGDGLTARDKDVQVDKEGDGLTARDEDVQVDKEDDGLTVRDEDVQVDKEGDGLTARDEDVQVDKEDDGLTVRDEDDQANKEGNCLTARVQADKEVDDLTARDEDIQVDKEGNGRDEDDQVDIEATNCYQSADNGSTQSNGFIPSGRSYIESVKVIMTASTIPPSFVSTISPTDDMEPTHFTESKKPPAQQNVPEPANKPIPTPESSFQCGISNRQRQLNRKSMILRTVSVLCMGLIGIGLLILIPTLVSSQALSFLLPLQVRSYAQETYPIESPDELTCRADGHTLTHLYQAPVCSALDATQILFLHSEPKHTEMLPVRVQSYVQETCPVESPEELTCRADGHTLTHIYQAPVCSALDATQLINTFRRLTADGINSVLQTSLIISTSVSSMFLQASEVPYFGYWSSKDATTFTSTAQLGHTLSLPPLKRKRKRSSSVNGKSAAKKNSEKCVCMGGERIVRMCFYATIIIIENSKRRTADSKRPTENLKRLCNGLFSVVCQPSVPIFFLGCISRSYADQGPHKELDETCSSLFLVLVHLTLVVVTLIIVLVVRKLHATNSKPSPIQRHGCTGAANAMSENMDDFSQPLGKDSSPSKPQHKTVCAESAGHEHKLSSEHSVSLFEDSSGCSVEEHHSTSPMIATETEPPDSQLNLNTIFFEHGDDLPDPPQNSEEDLSGSTPKPIEGHFSDYPDQQSTIPTPNALNPTSIRALKTRKTTHVAGDSPPPRNPSVANVEGPSSVTSEFESTYQSTYQFTPPLNRKCTGGIVTLSSGDQSIDPTVTTPIPNLQRVNNAGPHDIAHRDSQVTTTSNDPKPPLLDSEPEQRKSDTFLKPASPIPEVDMKLHDEDTTEPVLPSRERSGEDVVVGGSDCVNANEQSFFKSDVQGSGENSHAARIDEHPPDSAFVPNNGRPASNYNGLTTSEPPPGGTTSKQHVEPLDPSLTRKEVSLEGRGAQAETSGHTPPAKPPDGPDHSVKSSVNNDCGNESFPNLLSDTGQESNHPPLQYIPGVGLAEAQTTVTSGLPNQQTLNNTVCVASLGTNLDLEGLNEVSPTDTTPTSQQIVQSSSNNYSQAVMLPLSHSPQPTILPTDNLADDRLLSQNNPQQATNNSPSVTIVLPPCAIVRILTALIHILLYRRERVVDRVSSNCVAVPTGGASVRKPLVCEETDQSHGQLIVAVGNSEMVLCNILHGSGGANGEAHFSNNVHTHGHTIVVASHNVGGDLSSFNTLTEQQVGVVELAPPPSAEVEGNEHPPPEDRNVIMGELFISILCITHY